MVQVETRTNTLSEEPLAVGSHTPEHDPENGIHSCITTSGILTLVEERETDKTTWRVTVNPKEPGKQIQLRSALGYWLAYIIDHANEVVIHSTCFSLLRKPNYLYSPRSLPSDYYSYIGDLRKALGDVSSNRRNFTIIHSHRSDRKSGVKGGISILAPRNTR